MPRFHAVDAEAAPLRHLAAFRNCEARCVPWLERGVAEADLEVRAFDAEARAWGEWECITIDAARDRWPSPAPIKVKRKPLTLEQRASRIEAALHASGTLQPEE